MTIAENIKRSKNKTGLEIAETPAVRTQSTNICPTEDQKAKSTTLKNKKRDNNF